jgi:hypothetical protein
MKITDEMFDRKLAEILDRMSGTELLSIVGVYEAVSEELNNQVVEELENESEDN